MGSQDTRPIILHLGDPIKYNHDFYAQDFAARYRVIRNDRLDRESFKEALKTNAFGNFHALFRPHFQTGGEMGQWNSELISLLPRTVHIFASAGAGYNWADVDALAARGIWYANGAGCSDDAVSDTALWMILSVFRNFTWGALAARSGDVEAFGRAHRGVAEVSCNPRGRVLGLVGLGGIGRGLVPKARALGLRVVYFDVRRVSVEEEEKLGVGWCGTLEELLGSADCVSLHCPLNEKTRRLINRETIAMMKDGARLINTSRGGVVDEAALVQALRSEKLSAAGLDVHEDEPWVNRELAAMENVTLTTHVGGGAKETRIGFELNAMKNVLAVVGEKGERVGEPLTPVNRPVFEESGH